jgi:hypothetical protein
MAKKPEPPKPMTWAVYKIAAKQTRLDTVEAADEREAISYGGRRIRATATKLYAVRRS